MAREPSIASIGRARLESDAAAGRPIDTLRKVRRDNLNGRPWVFSGTIEGPLRMTRVLPVLYFGCWTECATVRMLYATPRVATPLSEDRP